MRHVANHRDVKQAIRIILEAGLVDGAHHKQWVLDQVLRKLTGDGDWYDELVECVLKGDWDEGVPPWK